MKKYSEKDLVEFGKYLLSKEREDRIKFMDFAELPYDERFREVYHADIANWEDSKADIEAEG